MMDVVFFICGYSQVASQRGFILFLRYLILYKCAFFLGDWFNIVVVSINYCVVLLLCP